MALGYIKNGQHYKVFGGSGGGGHTIWNKIKTALTSRPALWFKDAKTTDDSTNESTNVELMSTVTSTAFNALPTDGTADGFYVISDGTSEAIDASDVSYLSSSVKDALDSQSFVTATHSKTGTTHAITLPDSSVTTFKFVATSDYTAGDTFTVDGVTVTAKVADSSSIPSGAFKSNSTVIAVLDSTTLNLINVDGTKNASGVYYDNTLSGLTANNVQGAIDELSVRVINKIISQSYTGSPTDIVGVITEILTLESPHTWDVGTYAGKIQSTHSGGGDLGSWAGTYQLTVGYSGNYGTRGIISAQGCVFEFGYENAKYTVHKLVNKDLIDGVSSNISINSTYVTSDSAVYSKYSRSGYMHNLCGQVVAKSSIPAQTTLVYPPSASYCPEKVLPLRIPVNAVLMDFGFSSSMGLYCDQAIQGGHVIRFNFSWYKKY